MLVTVSAMLIALFAPPDGAAPLILSPVEAPSSAGSEASDRGPDPTTTTPPSTELQAPERPRPRVRPAPRVPDGFVLIRPGLFDRGSLDTEAGHDRDEAPRHPVALSRAFIMGQTEVTRAEWRARLSALPAATAGCADDDCPVDQITWYEAAVYANARSLAERLPTCYALSGCTAGVPIGHFWCEEVRFVGLDCRGYRLPTEAEWEFAARAGTTTSLWVGADPAAVDAIAWHQGNSGGRLQPVRTRAANPWRVYDLQGNALEWVHDRYGPYPYALRGPLKDPVGADLRSLRRRDRDAPDARVVRGGAYWTEPERLRAAERGGHPPRARLPGLGFRLARTWTTRSRQRARSRTRARSTPARGD